MALGDYILCCKCDTKLIYDGDRGQREWWKQRFGKPPEIECPNCKTQRTWQGLTDDEIALINADYPHPQGFAKAIQARLKEKNT
jgi:hypothetical protein